MRAGLSGVKDATQHATGGSAEDHVGWEGFAAGSIHLVFPSMIRVALKLAHEAAETEMQNVEGPD
jgi:hypothetical protein